MSDYRLILGDCIEVMRTLPANSCQVCVTSPPYFGLRDYGTATWEGGDAACDHLNSMAGPTRRDTNSPLREGRAGPGLVLYRDLCGKCGARRIDQQIGLEETPDAYVAKLVEVFREVRRVLRDDGTCWLNLGDTIQDKQVLGIPWRVAFALQADGWILRSEIIWAKKAPMPESVTDRPTKAHEQVFLLSKQANYFYDAEAIREPLAESTANDPRMNDMGRTYGGKGRGAYGEEVKANGQMQSWSLNANGRNKRSVWTLGPESYAGAHFAVMPTKLVEPCILAGSRVGDTVLDPFNGSGTTGAVALKHHRNYIGIDLNADYLELAHDRIRKSQPMLLEVI